MLPKTCQNICARCELVYFPYIGQMFSERFVLDSRRVFRVCQQPSGESSQLVTIIFPRVKKRGDLDSVSGTRRCFVAC